MLVSLERWGRDGEYVILHTGRQASGNVTHEPRSELPGGLAIERRALWQIQQAVC